MRVTSSKEIPPPPPRMPVTFHLDLDEDEALILSEILGSIGGEYSAFRQKAELMWDQLTGEINRQEIVRPKFRDKHYSHASELGARGLYPGSQLNFSVGRFDKLAGH